MDWEKRMKDRGSFAVKGKTDWWVETGGVVGGGGVETKDSGKQTMGLTIRQEQQTPTESGEKVKGQIERGAEASRCAGKLPRRLIYANVKKRSSVINLIKTSAGTVPAHGGHSQEPGSAAGGEPAQFLSTHANVQEG